MGIHSSSQLTSGSREGKYTSGEADEVRKTVKEIKAHTDNMCDGATL